ncbi:MAG: ribose 5-phosphate isomerase B [Blastocatellia bacterium]
MKVAIASDHAGFQARQAIQQTLAEMGIEFDDLGTYNEDSVDYPDYAERVAAAVNRGEAERGILVCGSGIGIMIAANKISGIRCALAWNEETARLARQHNDANIVAVGGRTTAPEVINEIVRAFLTTEFAGGRHSVRVEKISRLEQQNS